MAAQAQAFLTSNLISGFKQRQSFEPYRQSHWTLIINDLPGASSLALAVENGAAPTIGFEQVRLGLGNDAISIPGQATVEAMSITFRDFMDPHIGQILVDWWRQIYNPETGALQFAAYFKKIGTLLQWSTKGSHIRSWRLEGIWPMVTNFGSLDQQAAEPVRPEVQFIYDRAIPNFTQGAVGTSFAGATGAAAVDTGVGGPGGFFGAGASVRTG